MQTAIFKKDCPNTWKKGDTVKIQYIDKNHYLIDFVAIFDTKKVNEYLSIK